MEIGSTTSTAAATTLVGTDTLAENYDTFLELLTVQLRNQDPTEPLDAKEFTSQLTQFSAVEQSIRTNTLLESLIATNSASQASSAVGYLGTTISANAVTAPFSDGNASWSYTADDGATSADIKIFDSSGNQVHSSNVPVDGTGQYVWNGQMTNGQTASGGTYSIQMAGKDSSGNYKSVSTEISGTVDGIELSGGEPILKIGDISVPLSNVTKIAATGVPSLNI